MVTADVPEFELNEGAEVETRPRKTAIYGM
jgi:hypothetical protein